jgi:hypothetical protein
VWGTELLKGADHFMFNSRPCLAHAKYLQYHAESFLLAPMGILDTERWELAPRDLLLYEFNRLYNMRGIKDA